MNRMTDERFAEIVDKWPIHPASIWRSDHVAHELLDALKAERAEVKRLQELSEADHSQPAACLASENLPDRLRAAQLRGNTSPSELNLLQEAADALEREKRRADWFERRAQRESAGSDS